MSKFEVVIPEADTYSLETNRPVDPVYWHGKHVGDVAGYPTAKIRIPALSIVVKDEKFERALELKDVTISGNVENSLLQLTDRIKK